MCFEGEEQGYCHALPSVTLHLLHRGKSRRGDGIIMQVFADLMDTLEMGPGATWSPLYGGPQLSRQKLIPCGKRKLLTAKRKDSRQNKKPHGKKKKTHGHKKNLTAKRKRLAAIRKTSRQKEKDS